MSESCFTCPVCRRFSTTGAGCSYCEALARQSQARYAALVALRQAVTDGALTDWSEDLPELAYSSNHRRCMLTPVHWRAPYLLQFLRICHVAAQRGFAWGAGRHRGLPFYLTHEDFPDAFRRAFGPDDEQQPQSA